MLAARRGELRKALAEVVREALARGWVYAGKAEGWLEKLEEGRVLMEGWPKYLVRLSSSGALEVRFASISPDSKKQVAQRLREMGLEEDKHFSVKMLEEGRYGYVRILRRVLSAPLGFPFTAPANNGGWRRSSLSIYSEGRRRLGRRFTKKPKKS